MGASQKQILSRINEIENSLENALAELRKLKAGYTPMQTNTDRSKILNDSAAAVRKRREFVRKQVESAEKERCIE